MDKTSGTYDIGMSKFSIHHLLVARLDSLPYKRFVIQLEFSVHNTNVTKSWQFSKEHMLRILYGKSNTVRTCDGKYFLTKIPNLRLL